MILAKIQRRYGTLAKIRGSTIIKCPYFGSPGGDIEN